MDICAESLKLMANVTYNTNVSENYSDVQDNVTKKTPEFPQYLVITWTVFYVLIFIIGILGNGIVILVVLLNRNMRTSVNMFIINLCVADLLVLTVCMPTALVDVYAKDAWYFGEAMCKYFLDLYPSGV